MTILILLAAVAQVSRAMKALDSTTGIFVSAVCPGFIDTAMGQMIPKHLLAAAQGTALSSCVNLGP